ncbi:hypothetical protein [Pannonibacter indicus]|jgi:hypothetical protein|uniref:Uncharacterized protein n=1 Tax=Pannonibacter indicus TaxID=466044 RepID=A0A0K6HMJ9_9HYPH|nr:hypothetical protein [Pannonibacter indicus]CUA92125.1 hypothetical protein Ga0061067_101295 [Pannonibacter indicus]
MTGADRTATGSSAQEPERQAQAGNTRMDAPPMATIRTARKTGPEDEASLRPLGMAIVFGVMLAAAVAFLGSSPSAHEPGQNNALQQDMQPPAQAGKDLRHLQALRSG